MKKIFLKLDEIFGWNSSTEYEFHTNDVSEHSSGVSSSFFLVHWSNSGKITLINELQDFYVLWMVNGSISPQNQSCNI